MATLETTFIGHSTIAGIGLFADKTISEGELVFFPCKNCDRFTEEEFLMLRGPQKSRVRELGYRRKDRSWILICGHAKYLNHSCSANTVSFQLPYCVAAQDINKGEEITFDYRQFFFDEPFSFSCDCKSRECVGKITVPEHSEKLLNIWGNLLKRRHLEVNGNWDSVDYFTP